MIIKNYDNNNIKNNNNTSNPKQNLKNNLTTKPYKKKLIIINETKIVSKQNLFSWPVNAIKTIKINFVIVAVST